MTTFPFEPAAVRRPDGLRVRRRHDEAHGMNVSELVAVIGHELTSPLTTISAAMELMETAEGTRPNALTATVRRQVSRLLTLFDASLRAAELLGGARADAAAVTDLPDALAAVREAWPATEQRLHITISCPAGLPLVAIEDRAFQIIINNLLVNACKHSGGRQVRIAAAAGDGSVRVTVSDDGHGVPSYLRKRIFELGQRGDSKSGSGSGLGLYVTRELARAFGGDVHLDDAPGGASFVLTLAAAGAEVS